MSRRLLDEMKRRREARATWPVTRFRLGDEPPDDLSAVTTPAERIAMMWPLAQSAWALARRSLPSYSRSTIPSVLFRPGETPPDDDDA